MRRRLRTKKTKNNFVNIALEDYHSNSYYAQHPELFAELQRILNGHITISISKTLNMAEHKDIKELMIQLTPNMPVEGHSLNERLYWILHDMHDFPTCQTPDCINNGAKLDNSRKYFKGITVGYSKHCCNKCAQFDPKTTQAKKATTLKKHGDPNYRNTEKSRQTFTQNFGVDHPMKSKSFRDKLAKQHLEEFGKEWYFQTEDF